MRYRKKFLHMQNIFMPDIKYLGLYLYDNPPSLHTMCNAVSLKALSAYN